MKNKQVALAQIGERLQLEGLLRLARSDAQTGAALQQVLRQVAADKAVAADQGNQLAVERARVRGSACHCAVRILRKGVWESGSALARNARRTVRLAADGRPATARADRAHCPGFT